MKLNYPVLIAHRGLKSKFPENSMIAFREALKSGAQMIEFDVMFSSDRKIIVLHDETLDRTTSGKGNANLLSLKQIKELDAGSWFHEKFKDERVPTLEEVLKLSNDNVCFNIEIKEEAFEERNPLDSIENQVVNLVKKFNLEKKIVISSCEQKILERISKKYPDIILGLVSYEVLTQDVVKKIKDLNFFSWNPYYEILTEDQIELAHEYGIKVFSWTVNSKEEFEKLIKIGVDGVFSDDPGDLI